MDENNLNINKKTSILLSRNLPVALVVGAAGFLGSNLSEALLEKGIQVIGLDKDSEGNNLERAIRDKNFHLINESAERLDLSLERLDYIFIVAGQNWNIDNILKIFFAKKARCLFISWIDLYDKRAEGEFRWFKEEEVRLAKFAHTHNLNARILRLGPVFGPRMHFRTKDPTIRLIQASLTGEIQKEDALEFSSRALYISDAVDLIIKSIFAGSTAQKIFDGVLPTPVKVADIKQVLLDPVWYDQRGFEPSELPPWPTPNLEKTIKYLNWKPKVNLVEGLRKTLAYFKDNEIKVPELETGSWGPPKGTEVGKDKDEREKEKERELEGFKAQEIKPKTTKKKIKISFPIAKQHISKIYFLLATVLIVAALIYPIFVLGWGVVTFRYELQNASRNLTKGDFEGSLASLARAKIGIDEAASIIESLEMVRKTGIFSSQFNTADHLLNLSQSSVVVIQSTIKGIEALYLGLRSTTGELQNPPFDYFTQAQIELKFADDVLSSTLTLVRSGQEPKIYELIEYLENFNKLIKKAKAASILLPKVVSSDKSYLILLQNNMELRPGGGFIGSYGLISFEGGKLKKLEVNDIYAIDGQLKIHVEPPKEIKEDLGQKDWFLRDSNWESDFPTSAKQAEWFFNQETGTAVAGVFALDVTSMESLLEVLGPLDLSDYEEIVTSENLFEKAIAHAETGFSPGSQAKKSFLTALSVQTLNKLFFLPNQNWPGIVEAIGKSLETKHISIFLDDPKLFSYLVSQGFSGAMPRAKDSKQGLFADFLAPVEANLGANKANYYLDRSYNLETIINKGGEIQHRLKINYTNRSPSDVWPAGKYKNRLRIHFPFGTKLTRVLWGETDITRNVSAYVDFGRSTYSMLLELAPKQQTSLILDYEVPGKLEFKDNQATYRLDIIKQAGTLKDPLHWEITYPSNYRVLKNKVANGKTQTIGSQAQTITTDLSKDRGFEVVFTQ